MSERLFRRIENPNATRRTVLESSKTIIQNLKSYQKILDIHKQKSELKKSLKINLRELKLILENLKGIMPESIKAREEKPKKAVKGKKKLQKEKIAKKVPETSEVDKLELKLQDIESKLKTLS